MTSPALYPESPKPGAPAVRGPKFAAQSPQRGAASLGPIAWVTPRLGPCYAAAAMARSSAALLLLSSALSLHAIACGDGLGSSESAGEASLLPRLQEYRAWARAPGDYQMPLVPAQGTHGAYIDIYINDVVAQALLEGSDSLSTWPTGSVIVKDGFDDAEGTSLRQVAVMERRAEGWYWEEYDAADLEDPLFAGAPDICVDCHSAGQDSVRAFGLP